MPILFAFPGYERLATTIEQHLACDKGHAVIRHFPDGESYVKLESDVKEQEVLLLCGLDQADTKAMAFMFFTNVARELGAKSVGLIAPYLGYMRQDKRFCEGEAVTSNIFASFLSQQVDWLVTIDPHLHRHKSLAEIYTIPSRVIHAADAIAHWIRSNVEKPVLIGPDEESEQWVADVAQKANAPFTILTKIRHGDKDVDVSVPDVEKYSTHTPILIDDIISTARTMIETVNHLKEAKMNPPICIGVHAIFAGDAYSELQKSKVTDIVTCNTISHVSNKIDMGAFLADATKNMLLG